MYKEIPKRQVCLTAIILAISVMGDSMLYGVLPSHLDEFGLTAGLGAGLILSANRWIRLASNTWAAKIYNKFGLKNPFYLSVVLAITSTAAYGLFPGFWPLLIARIAWGICFSIQLVSLYMVVLREDEQYRGRLMGLYNAIFRFGSLMAVLVGGILVDLIGIRIAFLIIAFVMVLCFSIIPLLNESDTYLASPIKHSNSDRKKFQQNGNKSNIWTLLTGYPGESTVQRYKLLAVHYTRFTNTFAISGLVTATVGLLLRERIGESLDISGFTIGVATLTGMVLATSFANEVGLSTYFGHISDKFGRKSVIWICRNQYSGTNSFRCHYCWKNYPRCVGRRPFFRIRQIWSHESLCYVDRSGSCIRSNCWIRITERVKYTMDISFFFVVGNFRAYFLQYCK